MVLILLVCISEHVIGQHIVLSIHAPEGVVVRLYMFGGKNKELEERRGY